MARFSRALISSLRLATLSFCGRGRLLLLWRRRRGRCRSSGAKRKNLTQRTQQRHTGRTENTKLKDFFLVAEISEGADIGDDEGDAKLVIGAHQAELNASIFKSDAATFAVIADLHELI